MAGKSMLENDFVSLLGDTLEELKITKNALSVESKVRPATINDLVVGNAKQVNFETLKAIIEATNKIAIEKGNSKVYGVEDVFAYKPTVKAPE
ncbi:XRE family transcriptional regulator [Cytobacillus sp. FSL K6-0129]|uniref:helix-turn-helix domain-containing protein n=1 Tax=Cytobacillus sp. FSL K6-0129 TaxID=2921421 RepID=UPI0030F6EC16